MTTDTAAHPSADPTADHRFLGTVAVDARTWDLPVTRRLINVQGSLYGGAGIAAASAVAESVTGRPLRWLTCQFVGTAAVGEVVRVEASLDAVGRATSQCAVTGHVGERIVFRAVGASGSSRLPTPPAAWVSMPEVPAPADCPTMPMPDSVEVAGTSLDAMERRYAAGPPLETFLQDRPRPPGVQVAYWTRLTGDAADNGSPAVLGWLSDMVAMGIVAGLGQAVAGSSLDNTIRMVERTSPAWVLVDLRPTAAADGYGYGDAHLWSPDGRLLATASQTVALRRWGG